MKKTNRVYEFSKMYYDWVCKCLKEDEKFEELAFFKLGVDLSVRQKELIDIKFSQIDFPYVKDIEVKKIKKILKEPTLEDDRDYKFVIAEPSYYPPIEISKDTYDCIRLYCIGDNKLFRKFSQDYIESIIESIGDGMFNGHTIRRLGTILRFEKENNKNR